MDERGHNTEDTVGASPEARTCPSCGEARPDDFFRSSHPRTHCDVCKGARPDPAAASVAAPVNAGVDAPSEDLESIRAKIKAAPARPKRPVPGLRLLPSPEKRRRQLERIGDNVPDSCPVLGVDLDASPRGDGGCRPVLRGGRWVSAAASDLLDVVERRGLSRHHIELAAAFLAAPED